MMLQDHLIIRFTKDLHCKQPYVAVMMKDKGPSQAK